MDLTDYFKSKEKGKVGVDETLLNLFLTRAPHLLQGNILVNKELSDFYDATQPLVPVEIPRKKNGYHIEQRTRQQVKQIVGNDDLWTYPAFGKWFDVGVDIDGTLTSWVSIDMDAHEKYGVSAVEALSRINWSIPSQVKNFMVILRTVAPMPAQHTLRLMVRGSKGAASGGIWEYQLSMYLLHRFNDVHITLYDPNESDYVRTYYYADKKSVVTHVSGYHQESDDPSSNYDVVVDDAYVVGLGVVPWRPRSKYFSTKKHDGNYETYLHPKEGREFSHKISGFECSCTSELCRRQSEVAQSYDELRRVRVFCVELGAELCLHAKEWSLSLHKRDLVAALVRGPVKDIDWSIYRYVETAYPVVVEGGLAYYVETREKQVPSSAKGWWKASLVNFLGVPLSVLMGEEFKGVYGSASFVRRRDVVTFCASVDVASSSGSDLIWCRDEVRGYQLTGRKHGIFQEQQRKLPKMSAVSTLSPQALSSVQPKVTYRRHLKLNEWVKIERNTGCSCTCIAGSIVVCSRHFSIKTTMAKPSQKGKWITGLSGKYKLDGNMLLWQGIGTSYSFEYSDYGALCVDLKSGRDMGQDVV